MPITYSERITIAMGMSASQARLLTITGKLTDNELRSQTITNSKLRLAQKSSEASQAYMDALNTEKLTYKYYNDNGESASYNLTPALIYSYEPLKNQYSIQNASGQNLVSATDAKNYEETDSLAGFLDRYGLLEKVTGTKAEQVRNPDYDLWVKENPKPDKADPIYWIEDGSTETNYEYYDKFIDAMAICYSSAMVSLFNSLGIEPADKVLKKSTGEKMIEFIYNDVSKTTSAKCYDDSGNVYYTNSAGALDTSDCYKHVLAHLLEGGWHSTSLGDNVYISDDISYSLTGNSHWWEKDDANTNGRGDKVKELRPLLSKDAENLLYCSKDVPPNIDENSTDAEKLLSNYTIDSNGEYHLKTIYQKMVDLFYGMYCTGTFSDQQAFDAIEQFVKVDLIQAFTKPGKTFDEDGYNRDYNDWKASAPPEFITKTSAVEDIVINDKSKGQWYVNLWYMMNGSETANVVENYKEDDNVTNLFKVNGAGKNLKMSNSSNYKVIDDQLFTSNEWLTFALKNGIVTLKQASYFNPATDSGKVAELNSEGYFWNSTAYSSTTDIVAVEDEVAIAKAEVKYKNTTTEIENQDKKYDQDLKKLDSEHNALQTEYESLKSVIDKNVERSFKAFS